MVGNEGEPLDELTPGVVKVLKKQGSQAVTISEAKQCDEVCGVLGPIKCRAEQ